MELHVFVPGHGSAVVKILDVEDTKTCVGRGDGAVQQDFGGGETRGLRRRGTREIESVAAGTIADAVCFGFCWTHGRLLFAVGDLAAGGDLGLLDEEDGVGTSNALGDRAAFANALGEASKVVGHAAEPQLAIGAGSEKAIVHGLAGAGMDNGVGRGVGWNEVRRGGFLESRRTSEGERTGG